MDISQLKLNLESLIETLKDEDRKWLNVRVKSLASAFPFNEYEYIITFLSERKVISFDDYEKLREEYVSTNRYLELYGLSPRVFGEIWAENHIIDINNKFKKASKSDDPNYEGQYDLWIEGAKVEVKTSRAINTKMRGDLVSKAVRHQSSSPFWMNFQQIKKDICDVFIFIGVWPNEIYYWVLSNEEVKSNKYLSHQHRGGIEFQIGIKNNNISEFDIFKVNPSDIADTVIEKFQAK